MKSFKNGVPSTWNQVSGGRYNVLSGEINEKKFIVKLKERRLERGDAQMTPEEWGKEFAAPRKLVYAEESILNEMTLSPLIKAALADEKVQEKIHELGYSGIKFIEPILGGISRAPNPQLP